MKATRSTVAHGGWRSVMVAVALLTFLTSALPSLAAPSTSGSGLSGVVNVNTASSEELQLLPGVGASRAAAIVDVRQSRGGFKSVEELMDVKGIGPSLLERMRPHVTLKGRTTASRDGGGSSKAKPASK